MQATDYVRHPLFAARGDMLDLIERIKSNPSPLTLDEWERLELAIATGRMAVIALEKLKLTARDKNAPLANDTFWQLHKIGTMLGTIIERVKEII